MKKIQFITLTLLGLVVVSYSCKQAPVVNNTNQADTLSMDAKVARGVYLVTAMGCNDCHSPKVMGPQGPQLDSTKMLSGYPATRPIPEFPHSEIEKGMVVMNGDLTATMGPWGTSFAANLTPDETGLGQWTKAQFKTAITHGRYKGLEGNRMLLPPMPWQNMTKLTDEDINAIFSYLQSIKPVNNLVPAFRPFSK